MADSMSVTFIRMLPGRQFMTGFFIHPSGTHTMAADLFNRVFIQVDPFADPIQHFVMKTEWPRTFQPDTRHASHIVVALAANTFICSLFVEDNTKKIFIVIFSLSNTKVSKANELDTGLTMGATGKALFDIQVDEHGLIHCYSSYRIAGNKTKFQCAKIALSQNGKVSVVSITASTELSGNWHRAFFQTDRYYMIPVRAHHFLQILCTLSCHNQEEGRIDIGNANDILELKCISYSTPGTIIGSKIIFYAYVEGRKIRLLEEQMKRKQQWHEQQQQQQKQVVSKSIPLSATDNSKGPPLTDQENSLGLLIILDLNERNVQKVRIDMNEHIIARNARLHYSQNGLFYLQGSCAANCNDKTHFYIIKIDQKLEK